MATNCVLENGHEPNFIEEVDLNWVDEDGTEHLSAPRVLFCSGHHPRYLPTWSTTITPGLLGSSGVMEGIGPKAGLRVWGVSGHVMIQRGDIFAFQIRRNGRVDREVDKEWAMEYIQAFKLPLIYDSGKVD